MALPASNSIKPESRRLVLRAANGNTPNLLLAEDSEPVRVVTSAILKGMGCAVEAVTHGEQAVRSASERNFDVIVLDIEMPVMDGITAARSIRRLGGAAGATPLMALSAFLADSVRCGHWRDTFDIALPKPTNKNELHSAVETALLWHEAKHGRPPAPLPPVIDAGQLSSSRQGIADSIWRQLAGNACRDIEVCANQIEHLRRHGQHDAVLIFAAKLTSLGRTFAAPRLARAAQAVQITDRQADRDAALDLLLEAAHETVAAIRDSALE
jgi:CheY-like chemotaxis protein